MKIKNLLIRALNAIIRSKPYMAWQTLLLGDLEYRNFRNTQFLLSVANHHQHVFPQYRNINLGKDVVIVACGPSLNCFQPIPNAIYIGVNRSLYSDKFLLDYWFMQDFGNSSQQEREKYISYTGNNCKKFIGICNTVDTRWGYDSHNPSETDILNAKAHKYFHDFNTGIKGWEWEFAYDLSTMPLGNFGSVVFPALQFALWTNPRRIFLVGCDCSAIGHFYNTNDITNLMPQQQMKSFYKKLKMFAHCFYPETEIISVNPVGLKGVFRDWNQADGPLT